MKTAVASLMKNAENRVAEWIAYHFVLRFDTVILLDNASTDNTVEVSNRISAAGFDVRVTAWPMTGPAYQICGLQWAIWRFRVEFEWIACFDTDEFLVLPEDQTLHYFLALPNDVSIGATPWAALDQTGSFNLPFSFFQPLLNAPQKPLGATIM